MKGNIAASLGLIDVDRDMRRYVDGFEEEMLRGLSGGDSSLLMLPTYISQEDLGLEVGPSGKVAVIDAGGTNLRVALVDFAESGSRIEYFQKYPIPGFKEAVTAEEFFAKLAEYLEPFIAQCARIGFCFSNPAEILPNRDAKIMEFTKEVVVTGSKGVVLGEALKDALRGRGLPWEGSVTLLNDTVATQLGAMADPKGRGRYSGYIGLILGTGINASYSELNSSITKNALLRDKAGSTIINTEMGGYGGFPQSEVDRRFVAATVDPQRCKFEKMASGAYQYKLLLEWLRHGAAEGVFSQGFGDRLAKMESIPIGDADIFHLGQGGDALSGLCASDQDAARARQLVESFFDKVAFMAVATLTAMLRRVPREASEAPVCISAEGTTFYNARLLNSKIHGYMEQYALGEFGLPYAFARIEDATILGSAVAGLAG